MKTASGAPLLLIRGHRSDMEIGARGALQTFTVTRCKGTGIRFDLPGKTFTKTSRTNHSGSGEVHGTARFPGSCREMLAPRTGQREKESARGLYVRNSRFF
ncbi:hypothetical protein MTP99_011694 [Tenebrio molitor]|nr:hypothetical protein MTP99_011694 [Tenebrio molitor]